MKVLLVDNDIATGDIIFRRIMKEVDPEIDYVWVRSSDEAFKHLQSGEFDFAFIDYELDVLNGIDLISAVDKDIKTKIFILSGHNPEVLEARLRNKDIEGISIFQKKLYDEQIGEIKDIIKS